MDRSHAPRAERRRLTHVDRTRPAAHGRRQRQAADGPPRRCRGVVAVSAETLSLVIDGGGVEGRRARPSRSSPVSWAASAPRELIPLCHPIALTDLS